MTDVHIEFKNHPFLSSQYYLKCCKTKPKCSTIFEPQDAASSSYDSPRTEPTYLGPVLVVELILELAPQVGEHGVPHGVLLPSVRVLELNTPEI